MNMCIKFLVDIFKMAEIWHVTCQKQSLFTSFRDMTLIFEFYFLTDFDTSKSVLGSFFAFFAKIWPKSMYCTSKSRNSLLDLFYLVTWDDLDLYYHSKWYLQMSETLSMPISWVYLCLTSQFCSPMSPSPKCRTFWLWTDLWRHSWPRVNKTCFPSTVFPGVSNAAWILELVR